MGDVEKKPISDGGEAKQPQPQASYPKQKPYPTQSYPQGYPEQAYPQQPGQVQYSGAGNQVQYSGTGPQANAQNHQLERHFMIQTVLAWVGIFLCCGCLFGIITLKILRTAQISLLAGKRDHAQLLGKIAWGTLALMVISGIALMSWFIYNFIINVVPLLNEMAVNGTQSSANNTVY